MPTASDSVAQELHVVQARIYENNVKAAICNLRSAAAVDHRRPTRAATKRSRALGAMLNSNVAAVSQLQIYKLMARVGGHTRAVS